ncbi:unnamed protein product [Allacma fusca]|uniref:Ig-like domain-containing protein n=1 Tax=Allacma fusca TaxID=39272 RepID=A0A8J2PNJ9_9HEXA|nr:unnamed protein product [Allacma fusca]
MLVNLKTESLLFSEAFTKFLASSIGLGFNKVVEDSLDTCRIYLSESLFEVGLRMDPLTKYGLLTCFVVVTQMISCMQGTEGVVVTNSGSTINGDGLQSSSDLMKHKLNLFISPAPNNPQNIMVKRIEETLNLTCFIMYNDTGDENRSLSSEYSYDELYKLSWYLPMSPQNSKHRTNIIPMHNALTLIVSNLKESDSGDYTCEARTFMEHNSDVIMSSSVKVTIKPKKNSCGEASFPCPTGECIPKRFLCDGRQDCKEGADENPLLCDDDPCEGKLQCDDGRCISRHFCCERHEPNCSTRIIPACCKQLHVVFNMEHSQFQPQPQQFNDMGFLQTTIYTVIGCAMAFMFIITIMVIAICRVHLKRTNLSHYPHHLPQSGQRQDSWGNIFLHSTGGSGPYTSAASGLLVTYNINNGVQYVGRPVNPPPYSEVVRAPPREGPPPPYASEENIATVSTVPSSISATSAAPVPQRSTQSNGNNNQNLRTRTVYTLEDDTDVSAALEPLLSENNNGDINGNSTSEVHVEPNSNLRASSSEDPPNSSNISDCQI